MRIYPELRPDVFRFLLMNNTTRSDTKINPAVAPIAFSLSAWNRAFIISLFYRGFLPCFSGASSVISPAFLQRLALFDNLIL
jgi:hypothetical protein